MGASPDTNGSQFSVTLSSGPGCSLHDYAALKDACVFGQVVEDPESVLDKLNGSYCDEGGRPYADVRIEHADVLHDPFDDPEGFQGLYEKMLRGCKGDVMSTPEAERPKEEKVSVRRESDRAERSDSPL